MPKLRVKASPQRTRRSSLGPDPSLAASAAAGRPWGHALKAFPRRLSRLHLEVGGLPNMRL